MSGRSWLSAAISCSVDVEGYFAKLSKQRLKRGVFRSVVDQQAAINRFVAETNAEPMPFVWTADPNKIIAAATHTRETSIFRPTRR